MSYLRLNKVSTRGFTLVEIIVTLIAVGVLAAFFVHFMGTAIHDSYKSIYLVTGEAEAESKIEEIVAQYVLEMNSDPDNALSNLMTKISNGDYNSDQVSVNSAYIDFDNNGNEQAVANSEIIKITVNAPGNNLIAIIPKSRWKSSDPVIEY